MCCIFAFANYNFLYWDNRKRYSKICINIYGLLNVRLKEVSRDKDRKVFGLSKAVLKTSFESWKMLRNPCLYVNLEGPSQLLPSLDIPLPSPIKPIFINPCRHSRQEAREKRKFLSEHHWLAKSLHSSTWVAHSNSTCKNFLLNRLPRDNFQKMFLKPLLTTRKLFDPYLCLILLIAHLKVYLDLYKSFNTVYDCLNTKSWNSRKRNKHTLENCWVARNW